MEHDEPQQRFENAWRESLAGSQQRIVPSPALRQRLEARLAQASVLPPPPVSEEQCQNFQDQLTQAVARTAEQTVEARIARRVEDALARETGRAWRREATVHELAEETPESRYLEGWRSAVRRAELSRSAPPECQQRLQRQLAEARGPASERVVPLPQRRTWKRAWTGLATVAASVGLVFSLFLGSADRVLAETVRKDHNRCCETVRLGPMTRCPEYRSAIFGQLPSLNVPASWTLVASRVCLSPDGGAMVHNVYHRDGKVFSIHLLPPQPERPPSAQSSPRLLANGSFPVMMWWQEGWKLTACSSDLDSAELQSAAGLGDRG